MNKIIYILGGPGSGKGTVCESLANHYDVNKVVHISIGELLRERSKINDALGKNIADVLINGRLVPYQVSINLLLNRTDEYEDKIILIDGFPRRMEEVHNMPKNLMPNAVIELSAPRAIMIERIKNRNDGRIDASIYSIEKRLDTHYNSAMLVIGHYRLTHPNMITINTGNNSVADTVQQIANIIDKL